MRVSPHTAPVRVAFSVGLAVVLGLATAAARADNDTGVGDNPNLVALGLYQVSFHVHADDLSGPYMPPGLNVRNPGIDTLYFAYMRRLSPHFDVELALGAPPLTKSVAKGPATVGSVPFNDQTIATARWFAPSLLAKYYLFSPAAMFRPYLGVGVNYTQFYSRQVPRPPGCDQRWPDLAVPAGLGRAGRNVGYPNALERVVVNLSWSASWVNTRLTTDTAGVLRTSHVEFNPRALVLAAGYRF